MPRFCFDKSKKCMKFVMNTDQKIVLNDVKDRKQDKY